MLQQIIMFFLILLSPVIALVIMDTISFIIFHIYHYHKGYRMKKADFVYKKESILKRLVIQFPKRLSLDIYESDPYTFKEYGLHMFCGEQGSGKTVSVINLLLELKRKYPKCKIRTNMCYKHEDESISHWKQLVSNDNGEYGQIEVLDEIQTWFSSNQSKDFPAEMITEISQQRKQRKMLIGTAQVFSRIGKPIREQTTFVYLPMTIFGCLTIVRVSKPQYFDEETQRFKRYIRTYFFVHTDEIRNSFDTYKKIEKYREEGFVEKVQLHVVD